jgi:hypothetical protein
MLWMVVLGAYLSLMQCAGVSPVTVVVGLWFAIIVIIRITLQGQTGLIVMPLVSGSYFVLCLVCSELLYSDGDPGRSGLRLVFVRLGTAGLCVSLVAYLPASLIVAAVDKVDALLQTKTPQHSAEEKNV